MSRVLLTGATGFIGRHAIQPLLDRGFEVHAVARHAAPNGPVGHGIVWHSADLLDVTQAQALVRAVQPSHLLHCAWYVAHGKFWNAPENELWREASQNLYEGFVASGGIRAVFAGTCAEYEWGVGDGVCDEATTPTKPHTRYGASKLALFDACAALARAQDHSFAWGRVFFPYGAGEPPQKLTSSVILSLLRGEIAETTSGEQVRDLIHVSDVACALVAMLTSNVHGVVNVGTGKGVALRSVVAEIAQQMGKPDLVRLGAVPANPNDPAVLVANTRLLREQVGWTPAMSLQSGISDTIARVRQSMNALPD